MKEFIALMLSALFLLDLAGLFRCDSQDLTLQAILSNGVTTVRP